MSKKGVVWAVVLVAILGFCIAVAPASPEEKVVQQ
jgi:hypothetical protein